MTTVPAETLEIHNVRKHAQRAAGVTGRAHPVAGFDVAVDAACSSQRTAVGGEEGAVPAHEPAQRGARVVAGGEQ